MGAYIPFFLKGIAVTLEVTFLAMALAIPVSLLLALGRMSRSVLARWSAGFVIETFRGTSALVQLFWAFYVLPFFGINLSPLTAGVLVLGLNEASYFSEVVRSALESVPRGQQDAVVALHLPRRYRFIHVILPQALPIMMPPFGNAMVSMLKFTSLVSLVTVQDLAYRAGLIRTTLGVSGEIYGLALVIYFALAMVLVAGVKMLERHVNRRVGRDVGSLFARRRSSPVPAWALFAR